VGSTDCGRREAGDRPTPESDETALVRRCQEGDVEGFEALYRRYAPAALRVARLMLDDWGLAEDCLQ